MVWRIRFGEHGWLREVFNGPIITGIEAEAATYTTAAEAQAVVDSLPPRAVAARVVEGPAVVEWRTWTLPREHG